MSWSNSNTRSLTSGDSAFFAACALPSVLLMSVKGDLDLGLIPSNVDEVDEGSSFLMLDDLHNCLGILPANEKKRIKPLFHHQTST